jgi:hypothetical protein
MTKDYYYGGEVPARHHHDGRLRERNNAGNPSSHNNGSRQHQPQTVVHDVHQTSPFTTTVRPLFLALLLLTVVVSLMFAATTPTTNRKPFDPRTMKKQLGGETETPTNVTATATTTINNNNTRSVAAMHKIYNEWSERSSIYAQTNKQCVGDGLFLVPQHKLGVCFLPKVATTNWKFLALRLLGNHPDDICGCTDNEWGCLGGQINYHRRKEWQGGYFAKDIPRESLEGMMMAAGDSDNHHNNNWTFVTMIREPWKRVVSSFWEDHKKSIHPDDYIKGTKSPELQKLFLGYLNSEPTCHSHAMTHYCGLSELEYDHVVDLDDGFEQLSQVLPSELMTRGWEKCTKGNVPSFYDSKINSPHHGTANSSFWTYQLCTEEAIAQVQRNYSADFDLYQKHFPGKKSGCVPDDRPFFN